MHAELPRQQFFDENEVVYSIPRYRAGFCVIGVLHVVRCVFSKLHQLPITFKLRLTKAGTTIHELTRKGHDSCILVDRVLRQSL
jgi:hypothetical protein